MKKILFLLIFIIGCNNTTETKQKKNDLPFWEVKFFVNQLKELTDVGYITNINPILGTFHRNNVPKSPLKVKIMIKEKAIGIKLYENDDEQSIKVSMQEPIEYKINIKHNNNDIDFNFRGIHENDVVIISDIISTTHQTTLINLFKLGGKFHFHFEADDENKSVYDFEINDPSNFYFSKLYENLNKS